MAAKAANKKISKTLWFFSVVMPLGYVAFLLHISSLAPQYRPPSPNQTLPKPQQFTFYKDLPAKNIGEVPVLTIAKNRELQDPTKPAVSAKNKTPIEQRQVEPRNSESVAKSFASDNQRATSTESTEDTPFSKQVKQKFANRVLQVGSYRNWKEADRKRAELALLGLDANIETARLNNQDTYRVNLGPFKQERDFKNAQQTLSLYDIPSMTKTTETR